MKKELRERVITAINTYTDTTISDFLEDNTSQSTLIYLTMTLKHWANPYGNYTPHPSITESEDFNYLKEMLADPKKILYAEKNFTPADEAEILTLLRFKLNKIADDIIAQNNLAYVFERSVANNSRAAEAWWNNKTEREQAAIKQQYENLSRKQQKEIKVYYVHEHHHHHTFLDFYLYYLMCNEMARLSAYSLIGIARLTEVSFYATANLTSAALNGISNVSCDGGRGDSEGIAAAAAIGAFVAMAAAGIIGGIYAAKKACNSICNVATNNKVLRSLYRLAGIAAGAYGGVIGGMAAGAVLGSAVPGLGNVAGGILGGIFCGAFGAGVMAVVTKYTGKAISAIFNRHEINPTNPEKYKLTKQQKTNLRLQGFELSIINDMLKAVKREKDKIGLMGSWPWSQARKNKNQLNSLIELIKDGQIYYPIKIGNEEFDPLLSRFNPEPKTTSTAYIIKNSVAGADFSTLHDKFKPSAPPPQQTAPSTLPESEVRPTMPTPSAPPLDVSEQSTEGFDSTWVEEKQTYFKKCG